MSATRHMCKQTRLEESPIFPHSLYVAGAVTGGAYYIRDLSGCWLTSLFILRDLRIVVRRFHVYNLRETAITLSGTNRLRDS